MCLPLFDPPLKYWQMSLSVLALDQMAGSTKRRCMHCFSICRYCLSPAIESVARLFWRLIDREALICFPST